MNDALRRALADARMRETDVAAALGVDPKTVQRWITGRVPHPRHRWGVADLLGVPERDLWPDPDDPGALVSREIKVCYPHRSAVPREEWRKLFSGAKQEISILVYAALFLAEDVELVRLLCDKARARVTVRLLLADPESPLMAQRGDEEGIGSVVAARVQNAISLFRPLLKTPGVEVRQHQTVLYNSIFQADGDMFVNPQIYGLAAAYAPVLHLCCSGTSDSLFSTYANCFEQVWNAATIHHR